MQVKDYFSELQNLLRRSAFIENVDVKRDKRTRPKYRFHFMDSADKMVFRFDNAPHHPDVTTYPHHKHIRGEEKTKPSKEIGLRGVLLEIEEGIVR